MMNLKDLGEETTDISLDLLPVVNHVNPGW